MRWRYVFTVFFLVIASICGCSDLFQGKGFEDLLNRVETEIIAEDEFTPNLKHWFDQSPAARQNWLNRTKSQYTEMVDFDTSGLKKTDLLKWLNAVDYLALASQRDSILFHHYPISHLYGIHLSTPVYFIGCQINTKRDIENYLNQIGEVESRFGGLIDGLELRRKRGLIPPTFILKRVIEQCDSIVALKVDSNPILLHFTEKLTDTEQISESDKAVLIARCEEAINASVMPSYKRLSAYLLQLERASVSVAGVWQLPQGDIFYEHMLLTHSGVNCRPDSLYLIAKNELAAIEGELEILSGLADSGDGQSDTSITDERLYGETFTDALNLFERYSKLVSAESINPSEKQTFLRSDQLTTAKLMTDIGIHHKQWLRDQAIRFLIEHSELSQPEAAQEVDRIVVYPGLAGAEKIGYLKLLELSAGNDRSVFVKSISSVKPIRMSALETWLELQ